MPSRGVCSVRALQRAPGARPRLDPRLPPASLDAVLIVDAYHEIDDGVALLSNVAQALKPQGRVGVIDFRVEGGGGPGPDLDERVDPDVVVADASRAKPADGGERDVPAVSVFSDLCEIARAA